jgi:hypothetical protein
VPCGCDSDPIDALRRLFVDVFQGGALKRGRDPATRPVFLRLHGVVHGTFEVCAGLPKDLQVGLFARTQQFPVWVRFSSDVQPGRPDLKGTIGVAMKVFGVPNGRSQAATSPSTMTQDFVLQNHDVFFVDTAREMCEFTCLTLNGRFDEYLNAHPTTARILSEMEKVVDSVLDAPYWSVLPYKFGEGRHVKYKLESMATPAATAAPNYTDPFYLRTDLERRLRAREARFRLLVQFQVDPQTMPLDRATVRWSETESVPIHVGTLVIPVQDLEQRGQRAYGENLAFNPWQGLPEHQPVGSLADARRVVYAASADNRRNMNGAPLGEPPSPRPTSWQPGTPYPAAKDDRIVRCAIHPAIGVARVGNSSDEFFVGPQVVPAPPMPAGAYRDAQGGLKRQAAQFRIYGLNASSEVVAELTADTADIRWTVHVANGKASWYQWEMALDIPEAAGKQLPLRNASVSGDRRRELFIDGGPKSIAGKGVSGPEYEMRGLFLGTKVYLGEIRTDHRGMLLFLGGRGVSASPTGSPIFNDKDPNAFINADGWFDDICDGPVSATVRIDGREIPVEGAWVITAPPNYAPDLLGVRTLYDLLVDLYVGAGWIKEPAIPSFRWDVYPILQRLSRLQWVNRGFAAQFGRGGPHEFEDEDYIGRLARDPAADGHDLFHELRQQVLLSLRPPRPPDGNQLPWPWLYGDAMDIPAILSPRQNAAISQAQFDVISAWADGRFVADWPHGSMSLSSIDDLPVRERPAMLDRAALDYCLADAFHPGCEVTWPMRHLSLYSRPFRIRTRNPATPMTLYGATLTPEEALGRGGPLFEQGPGDLTRWMGLPWQADTAFCRAGYDRKYDLYQPAFWPARVPNHVLSEDDYRIAIDAAQPRPRRLEAFVERTSWTDPLRGDIATQMETMVRIFGSMGLLERRPGVPDDPILPPEMWVASWGPDVRAILSSDAARTVRRRQTTSWASDDEATKAPRPVRHSKG